MSGEEKAQQIGQLVTEYQAASVELAHANQRLKRIGEAFSEVGRALTSPRASSGDYRIENGQLKMLYTPPEAGNLAANLVSEKELIALIVERDEAQKKVTQLRSQLAALGIT